MKARSISSLYLVSAVALRGCIGATGFSVLDSSFFSLSFEREATLKRRLPFAGGCFPYQTHAWHWGDGELAFEILTYQIHAWRWGNVDLGELTYLSFAPHVGGSRAGDLQALFTYSQLWLGPGDGLGIHLEGAVDGWGPRGEECLSECGCVPAPIMVSEGGLGTTPFAESTGFRERDLLPLPRDEALFRLLGGNSSGMSRSQKRRLRRNAVTTRALNDCIRSLNEMSQSGTFSDTTCISSAHRQAIAYLHRQVRQSLEDDTHYPWQRAWHEL